MQMQQAAARRNKRRQWQVAVLLHAPASAVELKKTNIVFSGLRASSDVRSDAGHYSSACGNIILATGARP